LTNEEEMDAEELNQTFFPLNLNEFYLQVISIEDSIRLMSDTFDIRCLIEEFGFYLFADSLSYNPKLLLEKMSMHRLKMLLKQPF